SVRLQHVSLTVLSIRTPSGLFLRFRTFPLLLLKKLLPSLPHCSLVNARCAKDAGMTSADRATNHADYDYCGESLASHILLLWIGRALSYDAGTYSIDQP